MKAQVGFFLRHFCKLPLLPLAALPVAAFANASDWQKREVPMVGVLHYMQEVCIPFEKGDKVSYRMESEQDVYFDIHYHPDQATQFKERLESVKTQEGEFTSEAKQSYRFTWKNKAGIETDWTASLLYRVGHE